MLTAIAAIIGYAAGTLIALLLERLYTGAPWRGPLRPCHPALWAGAAGYLLARGRGPGGTPLATRYAYLPVLGAAAGAAIALRVSDPRHALLAAVFALPLLAFVATDFERHLLPNRMMYPAIAAAALLCWAWPGRSPVWVLAGGGLAFALLFVLFVIIPGFGYGDVKLAGLLGLLCGWPAIISALAVGAVAAGAGVVLMLATRRIGRRSAIAYGPYLIFGGFLTMLAA